MGGRGGPGNPLYVVAEGGVGGRGGAAPSAVLPGAAAGEAAGAAAGASWASRFGARVKGAMPGIGMAAGVVMAPSLIEQVAKDFGDKKHGLPRKLADALHDSTPLHLGPDAPHGDRPVKGAPSPKHYDPYLDPVRNPALRLHPGAPLRIGQPTAAATASTLQHDYSVFKQAGDATGLAHVQAALKNAEKEFPKARAQFAAMAAGIASDIQRLNQAPVDVGKHMTDELKKAHAATPKIIRDTLAEIGKLPPGAAYHAAKTATDMANQLASKGVIPKAEAKKLTDALAAFFAGGAAKSVGSTAQMVADIGKNFDKLNGVVGTGIDKMGHQLNAALNSVGAGAITIAKAGKNAKFAAGGRIPGPAIGDHIPILGAGGGLLGIADGGELVVNQHTERDTNRDLAAHGLPTLGQRVAGETRPHAQRFATGGRTPMLATGGRTASSGMGVASDVYRAGQAKHADAKQMLAAFETVLVEAGGMSNPNFGDLDSLGAFQQRSSWGSAQSRMNVYESALRFFSRIKGVSESGSAGHMAQAVQVSAFPGRYDQRQAEAMAWLNRVKGLGPLPPGSGGGAQQIARVLLGGPPGALKSLGQGSLDKARAAMNAKLAAAAPAGGGMTASGGAYTGKTPPGGTGIFDGMPVATWIIPELQYARSHGWHGHITSGWRSPNEVVSGPVVAAQGHSQHNLTKYPGGAVDFTGPYGGMGPWLDFQAHTKGYSGPRLIHAQGFRDDGHSSGTGGATGVRLPYAGAFGDGGQFTVDRPTAFIAGEKGAETVSVTPHLATGGTLDQRLAAIHAHGKKGRTAHPAKPHEGYNALTNRIESHTAAEWSHIHAEIQKYNHDHPHHRLSAAKKHPQYETRVIEDLAHGRHQALGSFTSHTRGPIHLGSSRGDQRGVQKLGLPLWKQVEAAALKQFGTEDTGHQLGTLGGLVPALNKKGQPGHLTTRLREITAKMVTGALSSIDKDFTAHKDLADKGVKTIGINDKLNHIDESMVAYWQHQSAALDKNAGALKGDKAHLESLLKSATKAHDKKAIASITAKLADVNEAINQGILDGLDARQKQIAAVLAGFEHSASLASTGVQITQGVQHLLGTDSAGLSKLKDQQGGFLTSAQQAQADQALSQYIQGVRGQEAPLQGELGYEQSIVGSLHGQAQMDAQQKIADLTLQLVQLEGSIKDQTDATVDLKSSTDKNTKATDQLTGSVVYTYQGETRVVAEQSSSRTRDMPVGL